MSQTKHYMHTFKQHDVQKCKFLSVKNLLHNTERLSEAQRKNLPQKPVISNLKLHKSTFDSFKNNTVINSHY